MKLKATPIEVRLATMVYYPLYGGGSLRFRRYFPGLKQRGIHMGVFTQVPTQEMITRNGSFGDADAADSASQSREVEKLPLFEVVDGVPVQRIELPTGWLRRPMFFRRLAAYCERRAGEIDVVQFPSPGVEAVPWVRQLRRLGLATVIAQTTQGAFSPNPYRRTLQRFYRRASFNLADRVVVNSSVMKRHLEDLGVSSPIQAIPNGVDLKRFRPVADAQDQVCVRKKLGLGSTSEVILAVGPVSPGKGTDILVEAFVRLCRDRPAAVLLLVGPRPGLSQGAHSAFHQRIQRVSKDANAADRIIFTGEVSNVEDYLRAADLLVFPSRLEGMPNAPLEAMACGLPVIMTPFVGLPEEFGTPGTHYVLSSWDPEALAADIGKLLAEPQYRRRLGRESRRWVESTLDVNRSLDQYATMYRELANGSRRKQLRAHVRD